MHFSSNEQEIIKHVASGRIFDLSSYLDTMVQLKEEKNVWTNITLSQLGSEIKMGTIVKLVEDEDTIVQKLHFFMALCRKLQSFQLLEIIGNRTFKPFPPMMMLDQPLGINVPPNIFNIFLQNRFFEIIRFDDLNQFINDGFLTVEEKNLHEERNEREKAQKTTIRYAQLSLLFSVIIAVVTSIFNYATYSNVRNVSISNLDTIKYPVPVSIIKIPKQPEVTAKPLPLHSNETTQKPAALQQQR
jgi:hypothetical protein